MKRSLSLAALATLTSGAALAQSSVTIYGRLNESIERQETGGVNVTRLVDNASRIGFKGTEDLGGGLKAGFVIEHGFNADTGTANTTSNVAGGFWGRESTVYLSGAFGTFRIGNMPASEAYFATADYVSMHNHDTGTSSDALYSFVSVGQLTNALAYTSPTISGFRFDAQLGLAENTKPKKPLSLAGNYDAGPLHLGLGYESYNGSKSTAIRALYELGAFTVGGYYEKAGGDNLDHSNFRLSGMYALGLSEFHVNYGRKGDDKKTVADDKASQATLGYNYNLSKRTKVFAFYTQIESTGTANDFSSFAVGVRHNF